ncbi:MAG TPA: hypothetical protein VFV50_18930 [Bdellovibrionales bacterium]|nr:hypothetical protein [Bdellovibrionales bacterium]
MNRNENRLSLSLLAAAALLSLQGVACQSSKYQVTDGPVVARTAAKDGNFTDLGNGCYLSSFNQPTQELSKTIDILFVPDTSRSVFKEREAAAEGIENFIAALPKDVNYRVGVVLAHGGTSPLAGRLYASDKGEPAVLSSEQHSMTQIREGLRAKLTPPKGDRGSDGGEMGLYSLQQTMTTKNLREIRSQGFYRAEAALAVVFIADENDICATYPKGVTPVKDPNNQEPKVKARDCKNISPERVNKTLRKLKGQQPVTIAGIIYTPSSKIEHRSKSDEWAQENEVGYGYLDLIMLSNGIAIDLAGGNISEGLSSIGKLAALKLALRLEFPLQNMKVNPESVEVRVDGTPIEGFRYEPKTNQVHLSEGGRPGSRIEVKYCKGA